MSSILKVDTIKKTDNSTFPIGKVLQVKSTTKTDTFASTSTSFTDVTGLSVSITPTSTSSKIFITGSIFASAGTQTNNAFFRLLRDTTVINIGDSSGSRTSAMGVAQSANDNNNGQHVPIAFLDTPSSTSSTTYKIQTVTNNGSANTCVNRTFGDVDANYSLRGTSTITVMEIGA